MALGSPIFPSGCEGKLGVALESPHTGIPLPSAADHGQGRLRKKGLGEGAKLALPCTVGREFPEP